MNLTHFDRLFLLAAVGLALMLCGGLNLALGRGGRRLWLRAPGTVALGGAVVAGLAAFTRPELATLAAGALAAVLLAAYLLGSDWLARRAALLRAPGLRWGLVACAGLLVVVGSGVAFDVEDRADTEQALNGLDLTGRVPSRPVEGVRATTDRGAAVTLREPVTERDPAGLRRTEERLLRDARHADRVIRVAGPSDLSNCHGWVFTGGKFLLSPDDVERILADNGYQEVQEPQPGDLVIYRQGGAVAHSAVVRYAAEGRPVMVEGKWGVLGVFLHPADQSFYGTEYAFYRSARQGHLLAGLGGSPAPQCEQPLAAEE